MAYPTDISSDTPSAGTSLLSSPDHSDRHNVSGSAINAIELKIGLGAGSPTLNKLLVGSGNGTTAWGTAVNNLGLGSAVIGTSTFIGGTIGTANIGTAFIRGGTVGTAVIGTSNIVAGTITNAITATSGTINGVTLGTPVIGTISVSGTTTALGFSAAIAPGVGSIADAAGGTLTANAQLGNLFYTALGTAAGNRTIGTPVNNTGYQQLTYAIKASGSANATIVWDSGIFRFTDAGTPAVGTAVTWNYFAWRRNAIDSKYDFQGQSKLV